MRDLRLGRNAKGRAVYAGRDFRRGEIIEICPVIVFRPGEGRGIFRVYWWEWGGNGDYGLPLGHVSMMNHGGRERHNVRIRRLYASETMRVSAARTIARGEELLLDYRMPRYDFDVIA